MTPEITIVVERQATWSVVVRCECGWASERHEHDFRAVAVTQAALDTRVHMAHVHKILNDEAPSSPPATSSS